MQKLATRQEHSSSSESPPRCGQAEHGLGVNSEADTSRLQTLPFSLESMGLATPREAGRRKHLRLWALESEGFAPLVLLDYLCG